MRKWAPAAWQGGAASDGVAAVIGAMVEHLGAPDFSARLLGTLHPLLPVASWSAYRLGGTGGTGEAGTGSQPRLFLSASLGIPDTTRDCWRAYLAGPVRDDRSLRFDDEPPAPAQLCHITAREVASEHRARVYDAHGMAERLSVVARGDAGDPGASGGLFAVNFYRHAHQRALSDGQIAAFEQLAPALLALARKQVALCEPPTGAVPEVAPALPQLSELRQRLQQRNPAFTARELDVCARLLRGMTHDGIAADLAVSVATVKTYRNRAFNRLGIHFRSELFARVLGRDG